MALLVAAPAAAHRPGEGLDEGVTPIEDPATSFAFYREFTPGSLFHVYSFEARAGQMFHAGVNIPQLTGLEGYGVTLALYGPGLPVLEKGQLDIPGGDERSQGVDQPLQALIPGGGELGGIIFPSEAGPDFFEPFTQTRYWGRQTLDVTLPASGTYYLVVWHPEGQSGKYVLATGTREVFAPLDFFRFPIWWIETRLYFEQGPQLAGAAAVVLLLATGIGALRFRRRASCPS